MLSLTLTNLCAWYLSDLEHSKAASPVRFCSPRWQQHKHDSPIHVEANIRTPIGSREGTTHLRDKSPEIPFLQIGSHDEILNHDILSVASNDSRGWLWRWRRRCILLWLQKKQKKKRRRRSLMTSFVVRSDLIEKTNRKTWSNCSSQQTPIKRHSILL